MFWHHLWLIIQAKCLKVGVDAFFIIVLETTKFFEKYNYYLGFSLISNQPIKVFIQGNYITQPFEHCTKEENKWKK